MIIILRRHIYLLYGYKRLCISCTGRLYIGRFCIGRLCTGGYLFTLFLFYLITHGWGRNTRNIFISALIFVVDTRNNYIHVCFIIYLVYLVFYNILLQKYYGYNAYIYVYTRLRFSFFIHRRITNCKKYNYYHRCIVYGHNARILQGCFVWLARIYFFSYIIVTRNTIYI
ncbi:pB169L [African swine fever virus]|uniref:PB169L n=1 Tax=African swine fever virus TaxID=10497 RepID=A0A894KTY4_ASF|nr:pB169L [African swine fever virus]